MSRSHQQYFSSCQISDERASLLDEISRRSLLAQQEIENSDTVSFDQYLEDYFSQS
jgi:hypothetical protein